MRAIVSVLRGREKTQGERAVGKKKKREKIIKAAV